MKQLYIRKLLEYLEECNPELVDGLLREAKLPQFLTNAVESLSCPPAEGRDEPGGVIDPDLWQELTAPFRPSRYIYLTTLLEEEFRTYYEKWAHGNLLRSYTITLLHECEDTFLEFSFGESTADNRDLREALIRKIQVALRPPGTLNLVEQWISQAISS